MMEWTKVSIYTSNKGIDFVSDMLYDMGITGIEIEDEQDFRNFLEENKKYWDYVDDELMREKTKETCINFYTQTDESMPETLLLLKSALENLKSEDRENEWGRLEFATLNVNEEDWANNWKQYFKPTEVGNRILIQPQWEPFSGETDRTVFTVNPGMTFGTGTHHTTKLCIEELEGVINSDTSLLDIGCGSGILSIISLLLGAKEAYALDIDPAAEHVAVENALENNVDISRYHVFTGDILNDDKLLEKLSERKYECIVANIVADVIIALLPIVKKLIKEKGVFICSGIIEERLCDVLAAMEKNEIEISHINKAGGWAAIRCNF